ncbi:putative glutathione S-transferase [Dendryphion nanum]|uniref:Glutathione S-transferase n=1 Tax=Dendryphion nanum TaxID=256645 RepID=A0A9P9DKQ1_9PLEO|nr:putative glutathione S-transferase [Dendryphion nanum]
MSRLLRKINTYSLTTTTTKTRTMSNPSASLTLFRGWDEPGKYVWSPFTTKLEFRLRMSHLPYTRAIGATTSGPKGKVPYVALTIDSSTQHLADSSLIIQHLISTGMLQEVNANLSAKETAVDLAVRALLEDKLCFYHSYERWVKNYYVMRDYALWAIPYPLRVVIGLLAYRGNMKKLHDQGTGRFSDREILGFKREIWEGVAGMLEESRKGAKGGDADGCFWVLGGKEPTEADASLYGFVVSVLVCEAAGESKEVLGMFPVVEEWARRIHERYFADYEIWEA